jgi:hypothetical protein
VVDRAPVAEARVIAGGAEIAVVAVVLARGRRLPVPRMGVGDRCVQRRGARPGDGEG